MKKTIKIVIVVLVLLFFLMLLLPQILHPKCALGEGSWKMFPNTGVDNCGNTAWGDAFTAGCDCGATKCWNGLKCVSNP